MKAKQSKLYRYLLLTLAVLTSNYLVAQYAPFFENYSLSDYSAGNQNWDISRAIDGKVYVANNNGLLVYDGIDWNLHQLPNKTVVRSVLAIDNLIYTGSYEEFGFWKKDDFGSLTYQSLSNKVLKQISPNEEVWQIVKFQDKIVFRSFSNLYIYDSKEIVQIPLKSTIISSNVVNDKLYICTLNEGIFTLKKNTLEPFYVNAALDNVKIVSVVNHENGLLLLTSLEGSFYLKDKKLVPTGFKIDKDIKQHQLNGFTLLENGDMVFGTIKGGVFITDTKGNLKFHISKENGLLNNTVLGQFVDVSNRLWLGLDHGISNIDLGSHHYFFNDVSGKLGAVYDVIRHKGMTYIGTNRGLFRLDRTEKLEFIEGSQGQVWDLKIIEDELFCGHNEGTFLVDGNRIRKISDFTGGWTLQKVPERSHTYIQGTYAGLVKFEKQDGEWKTKHLGKTTIPSRFLVFENPTTAWVAHSYKGKD